MKTNENRRVILYEKYGGLGDALQYSTLPEKFFVQKHAETYISWRYKPRNPEINDLVWGMNPFVKGNAVGFSNAGTRVKYERQDVGFISSIELNHGLQGGSVRPKIYYKAEERTELSGCRLIDLSALTFNRTKFALSRSQIESYVAKTIESSSAKTLLLFPSKVLKYSELQDFSRTLKLDIFEVASIFEYCNALSSAAEFVCQHSGGKALAVAMLDQNPSLKIQCLISRSYAQSDQHLNTKVHTYEEVNYKALV